MNRIQLAVALVGICPLALHAAEPATQPAVERADVIAPSGDPADGLPGVDGGTAQGAPGQGDNHHGGRGPRSLQPLTDKEVADAMQFMSQHSPRRYQAIESLPDGEQKTATKNFTARAYQNWMRMANDDSELYAMVVKRVDLEDQIFGKVTQLKNEADSDKKKVMMDELKSDVGQLLDIGLAERKLRLDRLTKIVKKEQKQLDDDAANRAVLVDDRLKAILKSGNSTSLVPNTGMGEGGGGGQHGRGAARQP